MSHQITTNVQANILLTLAKKGEKTYKQLFKKEKVAKSNRTVLYALKELEYLLLIKSRKGANENKEGWSGRKATYYGLTFRGLIMALYYWKEPTFLKIDEIAKKNKKILPLVFGKWDFFKINDLTDQIIDRLRSSVAKNGIFIEKILLKPSKDGMSKNPKTINRFLDVLRLSKNFEKQNQLYYREMRELFPDEIKYDAAEECMKNIRDILSKGDAVNENDFYADLFLSIEYPFDPQEEKKFLVKICNDKDLKEFVTNHSKKMEMKYESYLTNIREWRQIIENGSPNVQQTVNKHHDAEFDEFNLEEYEKRHEKLLEDLARSECISVAEIKRQMEKISQQKKKRS